MRCNGSLVRSAPKYEVDSTAKTIEKASTGSHVRN
jgi:hypothetical protein